MGVMECNRKGCDSIMCCHHSSKFGYICYSCLRELKEKQLSNPLMTYEDIETFMNTSKVFYNPCIDLDQEFEE